MAPTPVRLPRRLWLVAAAAALFISLMLVDVRRVADYDRQVVVDVSWEQSDLQPGRGTDGRFYGPVSFDVDSRGRIIVADRRGERLVIFSPQDGGERELSLPAGTAPADVVVPAADRAYVLDAEGRRLLVVGFDGETSRVVELKQVLDGKEGARFPPAISAAAADETTEFWLLEQLVLGLDGRVYVMMSRVNRRQYERFLLQAPHNGGARHLLRLTLKADGGITTQPQDLVSFPVDSFAVDGRGQLISESAGKGPFSRRIRYHAPRGAVRQTLKFSRDHYLTRTELIGVDGAGNLYLSTGTGTGTGRIYRLSPAGEIQLQEDVNWDSSWGARTYARVRKNGNLYVMVPAEQGLRVLRWRQRSRWVLHWRWNAAATGASRGTGPAG